MSKNTKIVFFDGSCGLCSGLVNFVIKHDNDKKFMFSPLQSVYAKTHLPPELTTELKSVVVQINGKIYKKSEAVLEVLKELGGVWSFLSRFKFLPSSVLNAGYDLLAKSRYKLFGMRETCRNPTPEERHRFLL